MNTVKISLSSLKRPERNVRLHTDRQLKEFKRSVQMFGQIRPIVVDDKYTILCGNGLYEAMLALEYEEADCLVMENMTENAKKKLMLADNRVYHLGVDDMDSFDAFIKELSDDLDIPGYDEDFLQSLVMNEDEVSEVLSEYGKISDDDINRMRAAETHSEATLPQSNIATIPQPQTAVATTAEFAREEASGEVRRSIICPHCGEIIWL